MTKKRVLSGMRPTGRLHIGHLVGSIENYIKLQNNPDYDCYFFSADWHATTDLDEWSSVEENSKQMLLDWIAAGIDPAKSIIFRQSRIHEHAELLVILASITPVPWLTRCPSYKDKVTTLESEERVTAGFLNYPILQTSDIIIYKGQCVPVGEDQVPHLELAREIVRRFHFKFNCDIFPEPEALLTKVPRLPGLDGRKMSKSFNNTIDLSESPDSISKKVSMMITDPARIKKTDKGHPEVCSVFAYHKVFSKDEVDDISYKCKNAEIGCVQCKKILSEKLVNLLKPYREIRKEDIDIEKIFIEGEQKARQIAAEVLKEVKKVVKIGI